MEVFNLPQVKGGKLVTWRSSFLHPQSVHHNLIRTHWFTSEVEVFCPLPSSSAEEAEEKRNTIRSSLSAYGDSIKEKENSDPSFFYLAECPLSMFIDPEFIKTYFGGYQQQKSKKKRNKGKAHQGALPPGLQPQQKKEPASQQSQQSRKRKLKEENTTKGEAKEKEKETGNQQAATASTQQEERAFMALSVGGRVDQHNAVCILPTGKMILSVDKDLYQQLGLTGVPSTFNKGNRFTITIELASKSFRPGKPNYERVKWCFTDRLASVQLLLSYTIGGKSAEITFPDKVPNQKLKTKEIHKVFKNIRLPLLNEQILPSQQADAEKVKEKGKAKEKPTAAESDKMITAPPVELNDKQKKGKKKQPTWEETEDREFFLEVQDWLGMMSLGVTRVLAPSLLREDSFLFNFDFSILEFLDGGEEKHQGHLIKWQGFFQSSFVEETLEKARKLVRDGWVPWVAVKALGFEDTPLSWGRCEHSYQHAGENDMIFIILPHETYWALLSVGHFDTLA